MCIQAMPAYGFDASVPRTTRRNRRTSGAQANSRSRNAKRLEPPGNVGVDRPLGPVAEPPELDVQARRKQGVAERVRSPVSPAGAGVCRFDLGGLGRLVPIRERREVDLRQT